MFRNRLDDAQFYEGAQNLPFQWCEQSFLYDERVRIKRWWLFDDEELWRENLLDERCTQRAATKNDDGKLLLCYSPTTGLSRSSPFPKANR